MLSCSCTGRMNKWNNSQILDYFTINNDSCTYILYSLYTRTKNKSVESKDTLSWVTLSLSTRCMMLRKNDEPTLCSLATIDTIYFCFWCFWKRSVDHCLNHPMTHQPLDFLPQSSVRGARATSCLSVDRGRRPLGIYHRDPLPPRQWLSL